MIIIIFYLQGLEPDTPFNIHPNLTDVHEVIVRQEVHLLTEGGQGPTEEDSYQTLFIGFVAYQHQLIPPPVQVVGKWFIQILGNSFQLIHAYRSEERRVGKEC